MKVLLVITGIAAIAGLPPVFLYILGCACLVAFVSELGLGDD